MDESLILKKLLERDKYAFSVLFKKYYKDMVTFAFTFLKNLDESEEVVQDVFIKIYESPPTIKISFKFFLLRSIQNKCIDVLRKRTTRNIYEKFVLKNANVFVNETEEYVLFSELQAQLTFILSQLPEELSTVFRLSRLSGYKNQEIADRLGTSLRTVESRLSRAIKEISARINR